MMGRLDGMAVPITGAARGIVEAIAAAVIPASCSRSPG